MNPANISVGIVSNPWLVRVSFSLSTAIFPSSAITCPINLRPFHKALAKPVMKLTAAFSAPSDISMVRSPDRPLKIPTILFQIPCRTPMITLTPTSNPFAIDSATRFGKSSEPSTPVTQSSYAFFASLNHCTTSPTIPNLDSESITAPPRSPSAFLIGSIISPSLPK